MKSAISHDSVAKIETSEPQALSTRVDQLIIAAEAASPSNLQESIRLSMQAEAISRQATYLDGLATVRLRQSQYYHMQGDYLNALQAAAEALAILSDLQRPKDTVAALDKYGTIYIDLGDFAKALKQMFKAQSVLEELGDLYGLAKIHYKIGTILSSSGDSQGAIDSYLNSLTIIDQIENKAFLPIVYNSCCVDFISLGHLDEAEYYGELSLTHFRQRDAHYGVAIALSSLGEVSLANGDQKQAIGRFIEALSLFAQARPDSWPVEVMETKNNLARAYFESSDYEKAITQAEHTLRLATEQKMLPLIMKSNGLLSEIYEENGQLAEALTHLRLYTTVREQILNESSKREIETSQLLHETQRAQAEAERQKSLRARERENYESLTQIKNDFVNNVTHDIKNPISIIETSTLLLKEQLVADNPMVTRSLNRINRQSQKIMSLVEDLLDLAQLEAIATLQTEPVDLGPWLETVLSEFDALAEAKAIKLALLVEPAGLTARLNKQHLGSAIENLLSNAIKYTPPGGQVCLEAAQQEDIYLLRVIDNGIGISAEIMPNIFDRFYRAPVEDPEIEGSGLGLNVAKSSVEQHGGSLSVSSTPGQGSTFTIKLPSLLP